jgi:hypothetical protein
VGSAICTASPLHPHLPRLVIALTLLDSYHGAMTSADGMRPIPVRSVYFDNAASSAAARDLVFVEELTELRGSW